jgi:hypothetical protein
MALMAILGVLVAIGVFVAIAWSGKTEIILPWSSETGGESLAAGEALRRYVWFLTLALGAGIVSGIVMMGAAGRLAMRLLAVTAGDEAQGRITEAQEIVGRITVGGSLGFTIFVGVLGGIVTGALYVLIHRWLPAGRWRGAAFGALLLVLAATRLDPLRPDNQDFEIVGPGWLSVLVFIAMGIGHGVLLAALAGRYSRVLPLLSPRTRVGVLMRYAPLLIFIPGFPFLIPAVAGGLIAVAAYSLASLRALAPKIPPLGRVLIAILALVALPSFLSGVADIVGRT